MPSTKSAAGSARHNLTRIDRLIKKADDFGYFREVSNAAVYALAKSLGSKWRLACNS